MNYLFARKVVDLQLELRGQPHRQWFAGGCSCARLGWRATPEASDAVADGLEECCRGWHECFLQTCRIEGVNCT